MDGIVTDRFGKWIKIRTEKGETVLKVKKNPPEVGELVRITDQPVNPKVHVAEKIFDAPEPLPSLQELRPLLQSIGKPRSDPDIPFLARLTEQVEKRVGALQRDFYDQLSLYYENGEIDENMKAFGLWLMTVSHPYAFRSLPDLEKPLHIFMDRRSKTFKVDFVRDFKTISIDGMIVLEQIIINMKGLRVDSEKIQQLRDSLNSYFKSVLINTGGLKDGLYA
ncbi:MAG TPA: hypothetical protein PLP64_00360 [Pseudothermotoga sp.]|nr:hypothetical protein [Pseudothermotoga sp.]HOK82669.1 hypothetical protein [Pseudothermotoga sp.]HPP70430.1 hypothetical protein [Pseudothermotoga sp.]